MMSSTAETTVDPITCSGDVDSLVLDVLKTSMHLRSLPNSNQTFKLCLLKRKEIGSKFYQIKRKLNGNDRNGPFGVLVEQGLFGITRAQINKYIRFYAHFDDLNEFFDRNGVFMPQSLDKCMLVLSALESGEVDKFVAQAGTITVRGSKKRKRLESGGNESNHNKQFGEGDTDSDDDDEDVDSEDGYEEDEHSAKKRKLNNVSYPAITKRAAVKKRKKKNGNEKRKRKQNKRDSKKTDKAIAGKYGSELVRLINVAQPEKKYKLMRAAEIMVQHEQTQQIRLESCVRKKLDDILTDNLNKEALLPVIITKATSNKLYETESTLLHFVLCAQERNAKLKAFSISDGRRISKNIELRSVCLCLFNSFKHVSKFFIG